MERVFPSFLYCPLRDSSPLQTLFLGFPRNDVDLVAVRTARNKHVCLQNDHVALMKEIEKSLQNFHQIKKTPPKFDNTESAPSTRPFARFEQIKVFPLYFMTHRL